VVPVDSRLKPLLDLTIMDLKRFDLERRLMHLSVQPQYFMYYNTVHGDILGSVVLHDRELVFEPLNPNFKGHFNPVTDNHNTSYMTSLKIAYEDIAAIPLLIPCPSSEPQDAEDLPLMYHLQLNLRHTGFYPYMSSSTQELVKRIKAGVASIDFKGMVRDIMGSWWKNEERKRNGLVFINKLKEFIKKPRPSGSSRSIGEDDESMGSTCVPFFDIEYSAILAEVSGQSGKGYRATFAKINQHLDTFKDIFGLKCVDKSISELRNQSFVPLGRVGLSRVSLPRGPARARQRVLRLRQRRRRRPLVSQHPRRPEQEATQDEEVRDPLRDCTDRRSRLHGRIRDRFERRREAGTLL